MRRRMAARPWLDTITIVGASIALISGMTARAADPPKPPRVDPVMEAMRKEALAKRQEQEQLVVRMRVLPGADVQNGVLFREEAIIQVQPLGASADDEFLEATQEKVTVVTAYDPAAFDKLVLNGHITNEARRTWLESRLDRKMDLVQSKWELGPAQVAKLRLAGRGDIRRLLDRIDVRKRGFTLVRFDFAKGQAFLNESLPLHLAFENGPFGDDSILARTLNTMIHKGRVARREPEK